MDDDEVRRRVGFPPHLNHMMDEHGRPTAHYRQQARLNNAMFKGTFGDRNSTSLGAVGLKRMATMAKQVWAQSYALTDDIYKASHLACRAAAASDPGMRLLSWNTDFQLLWSLLASWADQGLPVIEMPDTYAAALMATDCPADCSDVRLPWRTVVFRPPRKLLCVEDEHGGRQDVDMCIVDLRVPIRIGELRWSWMLQAGGLSLWSFNQPANEFARGISTEMPGEFDGLSLHDFDMATVDHRTEVLIGRLVINACIALENDGNVKRIGKGHRTKNIRRHPKPITRVFKLGQPVKIDVRPAIRAYIEAQDGTDEERAKRRLTVQSLVRGHYKMQVYGAGRASRRRIWIEPYWRGPDEAPDLRRSATMGKDTNDG